MDQTPAQLALDDAAATLRRIWAVMFAKFAALGVAPAHQGVTANWCSAIFRKMDGLLARYQAGTLRQLTTPRAAVAGRKIVNKPAFRVSRKWGWMLVTGKHHAAYHGYQIQMVLARPEMTAMLDASPQARRILRPLCRAFAVELPWTVDKPPAPRKPRVRKPRPIYPEDIRSPLPRGVKSWIRREKQIERALKVKHELLAKMRPGRPW